jgi:hypothetical protein
MAMIMSPMATTSATELMMPGLIMSGQFARFSKNKRVFQKTKRARVDLVQILSLIEDDHDEAMRFGTKLNTGESEYGGDDEIRTPRTRHVDPKTRARNEEPSARTFGTYGR